MKKIFCLLLIASAVSCKKEGTGNNGKPLLSKIYFNDLLYKEFIYSTEGNLVQQNNFSTGGGQSKLSSYVTYNYNEDGTIREEFRYDNHHVALNKMVFTYNGLGKVSRIDEAVDYTGAADFEEMDNYYVYEYDNNNRLKKITCREMDITLKWYEVFSYDEKGELRKDEYYIFDGFDVLLKQKVEIIPGDKKIPEHWQKYLLDPTYFGVYDMYIGGKKYTSYYVQPASVSDYSYKNRVYNSQGYLTSQTYETVTNSGTFTNDYTYEYVQQ